MRVENFEHALAQRHLRWDAAVRVIEPCGALRRHDLMAYDKKRPRTLRMGPRPMLEDAATV